MDYQVVKTVPKKVVNFIKMHPATGPILIFLGFIALVCLVAVLPVPNYFKLVCLVLGWITLEDVLHYLKFKYGK